MTILYVCNKDPRLTTGGNEQRTHSLWMALQKLGRVYTIVYSNVNGETYKRIDGENPISIVPTNVARYNHSIRGATYAFLYRKIGFAILPYSYPCERRPSDVYNIHFDIVVSRYIQNTARYHLWKVAPTIVDIDDHPIQVLETTRLGQLPRIMRPFFHFVAEQQFRALLKRIKGGWLANREQIAPDQNLIQYLPNIPQYPSSNYRANSTSRDCLFTIGAMSYEPNHFGVDRFLTNVWPAFHKEFPNIRYVIGGRGAPEELANKWNSIEGVEYVGFIENLEEMYERCIATVVPIYSGGGTCIKTLESLAFSRVCLSTIFGLRGLERQSVESKGLFVFDDEKSFIRQYEKIASIEDMSVLETTARCYVGQNFSMDAFEKNVEKLINEYTCQK